MVELEKPQLIYKSFRITEVVEKAITETDSSEQWIEISGYASKMFHSDGSYVIDADQENINTWGIDLSRLQNGILPLLFNHDQTKPVGSIMEATFDQYGLLVKAKLFKFPDDQLTNFVYHAVKNKVISSFSVGILVKAFDMIEQDDTEYLQLGKSECIEVSLVAVPSNSQAVFQMTNIKSVPSLLLEKSIFKSENNQSVCDGLSCAMKSIEKEEEAIEPEVNEPVVEAIETEPLVEAIEDHKVGVEEVPEIVEEVVPEEPMPSVEDTETIEGTAISEVDQLKHSLDYLQKLDIAALEFEQLDQLYEQLTDLTDLIESRVAQDTIHELNTIYAPEA